MCQVEAGYVLTLLQPSLEVSLQQNLVSVLSGIANSSFLCLLTQEMGPPC